MSQIDPQGHIAPGSAGGHEPTEVGIRAIFVFGGGLIVVAAVAMLVLAAMMRGFAAAEKADGTTTRTLVEKRPDDFPDPKLQRSATRDMDAFRKAEDAALESYGWVDRKAGIAQIPIERAMDLIARDGLPKPKPPEPRPSEPSTKE
jgi:hypothetical protein